MLVVVLAKLHTGQLWSLPGLPRAQYAGKVGRRGIIESRWTQRRQWLVADLTLAMAPK
jgi:hypothetical protein